MCVIYYYEPSEYMDYCFSFFVAVQAWRGANINNYGIAVSGFQVNEPPKPGNCTAFPLNGTAAETKFNVRCTDFYDQHKPVKYQVRPVACDIPIPQNDKPPVLANENTHPHAVAVEGQGLSHFIDCR